MSWNEHRPRGALYWHGLEKCAEAAVRGCLTSLAEEAKLDPHKFRLTLEPSARVDTPSVFSRTVRHSPSVSIQIEPEELQRLVPYAQSFPGHWERDVLVEAGSPEPATARDVALPYEQETTRVAKLPSEFDPDPTRQVYPVFDENRKVVGCLF